MKNKQLNSGIAEDHLIEVFDKIDTLLTQLTKSTVDNIIPNIISIIEETPEVLTTINPIWDCTLMSMIVNKGNWPLYHNIMQYNPIISTTIDGVIRESLLEISYNTDNYDILNDLLLRCVPLNGFRYDEDTATGSLIEAARIAEMIYRRDILSNREIKFCNHALNDENLISIIQKRFSYKLESNDNSVSDQELEQTIFNQYLEQHNNIELLFVDNILDILGSLL
jgi:hypothetical protein